jgi:drug/metabolite transporter (DMT)-like permease
MPSIKIDEATCIHRTLHSIPRDLPPAQPTGKLPPLDPGTQPDEGRMNESAGTTRNISPALARTGVLLAVVFWGTSFVATKLALRELSPITLVFVRFTMGSLLLAGLLRHRGGRFVPSRDTWAWLALMGFVGVFVHQLLQVHGLKLTSAVTTGWLIGLIPLWTAVLSRIVLGERMSRQKIAGLAVGFLGAILLITRGEISPRLLSLPATRGDLLVLLSTLNWAVYSVLGHGTLRKLGAVRATAGAMILGWLMLAPLFLTQQGWRELGHVSAAGWGSLVFLGVGCSGLGYLFWYGGLEHLEASSVASFLYLEPLVTLAAAALVLGERPGALTLLGGLIVLAGVWMVQKAPRVASA